MTFVKKEQNILQSILIALKKISIMKKKTYIHLVTAVPGQNARPETQWLKILNCSFVPVRVRRGTNFIQTYFC